MDDSPYAIEATQTSLRILEHLVDVEKPVGTTRIADDLDAPKSVVHNHLSTLERLEYVEKRDRKYRPTLRPLALGDRTRASMRVYRAGRREVDNLADATGEAVVLFVEEDGYGVPLHVSTGSEAWSPPYRVGERIPLHLTAPGKAILASVPMESAAEMLAEAPFETPTDHTIADPEELERQLRTVNDGQVWYSREEQFPGVIGVGASVRSGDDAPPAALGIVGPVDRFNGRYLEEDLSGQVISTANSISVALSK